MFQLELLEYLATNHGLPEDKFTSRAMRTKIRVKTGNEKTRTLKCDEMAFDKRGSQFSSFGSRTCF